MKIKEFFLLNNPRLFKVGDRVKIYFKNKWWKGIISHFTPAREKTFKVWSDSIFKGDNKYEIIEEGICCGLESIIYDDYHFARMYIRTDEKVDSENDALFDGFGIRSNWSGENILFENEPEYISEEYHLISNIDLEHLPF